MNIRIIEPGVIIHQSKRETVALGIQVALVLSLLKGWPVKAISIWVILGCQGAGISSVLTQ
jgi:hypothetical protein